MKTPPKLGGQKLTLVFFFSYSIFQFRLYALKPSFQVFFETLI